MPDYDVTPLPADARSMPGSVVVPVTKANSDLPDGMCRCLLVGTAGTANIEDGSGVIRTNVPLQQGYNAILVKQVRTGGTASDIWAIY